MIATNFPSSPLSSRLNVSLKNLVLQNGVAEGGIFYGRPAGRRMWLAFAAGGTLFVNGAADVTLTSVSLLGTEQLGVQARQAPTMAATGEVVSAVPEGAGITAPALVVVVFRNSVWERAEVLVFLVLVVLDAAAVAAADIHLTAVTTLLAKANPELDCLPG